MAAFSDRVAFRIIISDALKELIIGILKKDPGLRLMLAEIKVGSWTLPTSSHQLAYLLFIASFPRPFNYICCRLAETSLGDEGRRLSDAERGGELPPGRGHGRGNQELRSGHTSSGHAYPGQGNGPSKAIRQPFPTDYVDKLAATSAVVVRQGPHLCFACFHSCF